MKTVLITGAAGNVGSQLRSEFAGRYKLRLSDKRLLSPSAGETFVQADIVELADALTISEGTDTIVHLGGYASEGPWETILQANIIGCYNVFEAARRKGRTPDARASDAGADPVNCDGPRPKGGQLSLREMSKELAASGFLNEFGKPYAAKSVVSMLR